MQMNGRRRALLRDEGGDGRLWAAFAVMGMLTVMFAVLIIYSQAPNVGPQEGKLAPNLIAPSHAPGAADWGDQFVLYDELNRDWVEGEAGSWYVIQFIDTDCGHCWTEAEEMSIIHDQFGNYVKFITVGISLGIPGWSTSPDEIIAFQERSDYNGCNNGNNCNTRPGEAHSWTYLNDIDGSEKSDWEVSSTPFVIILQPNGVVAWNMGQHEPQEGGLPAAMNNVFGGGA